MKKWLRKKLLEWANKLETEINNGIDDTTPEEYQKMFDEMAAKFKSPKDVKFKTGDRIRPIKGKHRKIETIYGFDIWKQCYVLDDWTEVMNPRYLSLEGEPLWEIVGSKTIKEE